MPHKGKTHLDDLIEEALRGESDRALPLGFRSRMDGRLRVAALLDQERRQFLRCWLYSAFSTVAVVLIAVGLWWVGDAPGAIARSIPGALGSFDHFLLTLQMQWPAILSSTFVLLTAMGTSYYALFRSRTLVRAGAPDQ